MDGVGWGGGLRVYSWFRLTDGILKRAIWLDGWVFNDCMDMT